LVSKPDNPDPALAAAIRQLREQRGETQEDVAYRTRMTAGSYGRIERGKANPTWTNVRRIAQALEISVTELAQTAERAD
jgi:transcriptional regulator with XRE-family HTH domain